MSSQLEALVYVVSTSLSEMKALLASVNDADPRTIDAKLRLLEAVASNLSSGADRLSKHLDTLPPDDPNAVQNGPQPPEDDDGLLLKAALCLGEIVGEPPQ
ncbi:hypothetical protein RGUI_1078 [Rhodovulum sp. P5]|uniref:hypothetical protein n=1 Tax=Rhodovulum sp. P5 TaxID=1564506 RepID=UPI0009C395B5|nr:hypothetical protein [Rhodovulum sp. P5]ARE39219.1 hypothetical protein RGUI_1078 [Rhodovulum sp. P5]